MDNFLAVLITVVSSILVFSITESTKELWIEPLKEYKQIKKRIAKMFELYDSNFFEQVDMMQSGKNVILYNYDDVSKELKEVAAEIKGLIEVKPFLCIGIPRRKN